MVTSLACGVTRVASIHDAKYDNPNFSFLQDPLVERLVASGALPLPGAAIRDWHAQVHGESGGKPNDNPNLIAGFTFYATQIAYLLDRMSQVIEPDGNTLLHNSLVVWVSEFGDGSSHSSRNLPVVLAGNAGGMLTTDRHVATTNLTTGDLYTSVLNMFGVDESTFGFSGDASLQHGGVPGLIV
jgi:hypothetical protein